MRAYLVLPHSKTFPNHVDFRAAPLGGGYASALGQRLQTGRTPVPRV